jgi:hypothetical protein
VLQVHCASYWFGFCELSSMHNEPVFAKFAVINVQPRFSAVLPCLWPAAGNAHWPRGQASAFAIP